MGYLYAITIDIEGESTLATFEVIEIVDDSNPYPALLGIDWPFEMDIIINLKKHKMSFERKELKLTVPLDLTKHARYTELIHN